MEPDGFIGGVFVGYNKKFDNNFLLGIEGAFNYTNIKDTKVLKIQQDPIGKFTLKQQNEAALYLRAGYVTNNNLMPYILGGVTWTKLKGGLNIHDKLLWDSDSVTGWTAGAGLEYKINKKWHVRAQYRYSRYKEAKFSWKDGIDTYKGKTNKYRTHSIVVGVSYHFK
jgi:outer membrane immunogenic protein